ncbi:MAG TPA: AarF/UbiB family protein [Ktedonobacterales bacterium]
MTRTWKAWGRRNPIWRSYRVGLLLLRTLYIINRERTRVIRAHARGDYDMRPNMDALLRILREFRQTAVDLGGLLIKLGQFLGARADLLPQEALNELASLHDDVPPERFDDIKAVIEREWHGPVSDVCASINPDPTGSASLGQVHEARLRDGRRVAVKVQRPGISAIVRTDLRTLRFVLRVVARLVPAANEITDLRALYREFSRTVFEELDYEHEARNAERFAAIFADDPKILVPGVLAEHTTRRVLVLEWIDGIKVTDFAALDAAHVDRIGLANRLAGAYFKQVLAAGFFHADPHPGNILIQPATDGDRIVFVDFGMMGLITPRMREGLSDCFRGVVAQDAGLIVRGLDKLGFLATTADREVIERVVGAMLAHFSGGTIRQQHEVNPREVLGDMETTLYDQPFRLPAQLAFFGRMAGMLLGLTVALSPSFDFVAVATPYAQQFMGRGGFEGVLRLLGVESMDALGRDLLREGVATLRSLAAMPRRLDHVLERAERGDLHLVVDNGERERSNGQQRKRGPVGRALNQPVPIWLPATVVGAFALTRLFRRLR